MKGENEGRELGREIALDAGSYGKGWGEEEERVERERGREGGVSGVFAFEREGDERRVFERGSVREL